MPAPLRSGLNSTNSLICEAAIFALARLEGSKAIPYLLPLLQINAEVIQIAVIEVVGKLNTYEEIKLFSKHESDLVKSGFIGRYSIYALLIGKNIYLWF